MSANSVCVRAAIMLVIGVALSAQGKPDLAGTWTPVGANADPKDELKITQSASTLTAATAEDVVRYRLDGVETRTTPMEGTEVISKASWDGNRLVIVNTFMVHATKGNVHRQVWSLDASGQLVIEDTKQAAGRPDVTTKTVYKKRISK